MTKVIVVGITGLFGSGKTTAGDFFNKHGFTSITLSSFLEEEAKKRGKGLVTRRGLQDVGNEWRKTYGRGILAEKAIESIEKSAVTHAVVDGIRNIGEIAVLRSYTNFSLLAILADKHLRFERLQKLERREKLTRELFDILDRRDAGLGQKNAGLHAAACIKQADFSIENSSTYGVFIKKLEKFLKTL